MLMFIMEKIQKIWGKIMRFRGNNFKYFKAMKCAQKL